LRINPREQFELDSLEAISVLVDRGLGVSLIPDWPAPWPHGISVRKVAIPGAPVREIGLVWPRASARLRLTEAFIQEIRAVLPPPA
jgi:DNA-binding transcriptional LysR family regulator